MATQDTPALLIADVADSVKSHFIQCMAKAPCMFREIEAIPLESPFTENMGMLLLGCGLEFFDARDEFNANVLWERNSMGHLTSFYRSSMQFNGKLKSSFQTLEK